MLAIAAFAQTSGLKQALTFHASFDKGFDADFSRGKKTGCFAESRTPYRSRRMTS